MHKYVSRLIFAITASAALLLLPEATAQKHEKSVGLHGGYTTTHDAPVAGLYFQYRFSNHFRLSPSIDYYFRHKGTDAFTVNLNADFPFAVGNSGKFNIYPIAGVNLTSCNYRTEAADKDSDDSTTRRNRLGFNVGGGAEYYITSTMKVAVEAKYDWVLHYDGGVFTASIGYLF